MKKSDFAYSLPEHLIAQAPLPNRTDSRLLLLNKTTGRLEDNKFANFIDFLSKNDVVVFNNTKVIPARLYGQKTTGGQVEILLERITGIYTAIAHTKASKAPKSGSQIQLGLGYTCKVINRQDDLFHLQFSDTVATVLTNIGHVPLPPYIKRTDDPLDMARYQTVFAQEAGAVAAPTAGLHFDAAMLEKLQAKGITTTYVTLHVGSGTFQPVRVENLVNHTMHQEYFAVPAATVKAVQQARKNGGKVVAIGTTAVRALESASQSGELVAGTGDTDLFITPGYTFKSVDALLTNFHLPESTLLMLVAAFAGYEPVMAAYRHAISQSYRFFSYGDAMLLID
jgi:S-adenosylmethionine:tRNA ribosyltransferase-isomerase